MHALAERSQIQAAAARGAGSRAGRPAVPSPESRQAAFRDSVAAAPFPAGAGVVQRLVEYDAGAYKGNADRPGWRMRAENKLAGQLNAEEGTSYTGKDVNFKTHKKDRGHGVAFDRIQRWVVNYLNSPGPLGYAVLKADVTGLLSSCPDDERVEAMAALATVHAAINAATPVPDTVVKASNSLLSMLNSVSENLTPTSKYVNTYVGSNFHPDFVASPGGTHISATDHTKTMARLGADQVNPVLRTPTNEERVIGIKGGAEIGSMTPETQGIFSTFPFETRNMNSAKVKKELAPPNPYLSSSSSSAAPTTPKPKINLTPSSAAMATSSSSATPMATSSSSGMAASSAYGGSSSSSGMAASSAYGGSSSSSYGGGMGGFQPMPNPYVVQYHQVTTALNQLGVEIQQYQLYNMQVPQHLTYQYSMLTNQYYQLKQFLGI